MLKPPTEELHALMFWVKFEMTSRFPTAHASQACSVDFDEEFIITGSDGCTIAVWEKETGSNIHLLSGHTQGNHLHKQKRLHLIGKSIVFPVYKRPLNFG